MDKQNKTVLEYALAFLEGMELEPDEDSCMGMAFVTSRVSEDAYYIVVNKIEKALKEAERTGQ